MLIPIQKVAILKQHKVVQKRILQLQQKRRQHNQQVQPLQIIAELYM